MEKELLSPDTLTEVLKTRRLELINLLELKLKAQKNLPKGHLRIEQKKGGRAPQYYHFTNPANTHGTYIPAAKLTLAHRLAQKDYDHKLIQIIQKQLSLIEKLILATENKINNLYTKACPTRQSLITPVTLPDNQYVELWKAAEWQGLPFAEDAPEYFTANNVKVRSKSEILIADTLGRYNVPYRYEYPLELKDGRTFHPDFLCLNVRTRREYIWEHFGLLDDPAYASRAAAKLLLFSENKIFLGKKLIITTETAAVKFSSRQVEDFIKEFLL